MPTLESVAGTPAEKKHLKLLFVTTAIFYPDSSGGAERSLLYLFESLRRRGWEIELVCGQSLRHPRFWAGTLARLGRLEAAEPFTLDDETGFPCFRWPSRFRKGRRLAEWFRARLREFQPDVVLGYNDPRCRLLREAASRGYPALFFARSLANVFGPGRFIPDGIELIANSPYTASVIAAATGKHPGVVLPSVDPSIYRAEKRERRFITFVNPMPEKGAEVAYAVAREMPDRRFLFVKGRWAERSYAGVVGAPNIEVWDYQEDMRRVYAVTDVLLMPSQWPETFGRVALEAQASGIPVVAADVGGIPYVVGRGGILVAQKSDPGAYARALRSLGEDPALYAECSARALENVERPEFAPEQQVDAFVAIAERRLAASAGPLPDAAPRGHPAPVPAGTPGLAAATLVVSLLQGPLFAFTRPGWRGKAAGVALGLTGLLAAVKALRGGSRLHFLALWLLLASQAALFAQWALPLRPLPAPAVACAALLFSYGSLALAGALAAARVVRLPEALLLAASLTACLLTANTVVQLLPRARVWPGPEWVGGAESHPRLGYVNRPHSTALTYYPDNPRGYFERADVRQTLWELETSGGSSARLVLPADDRRAVRVEIGSALQPVAWHVQLRKAGLAVRDGRSYVLSFRARADAPRRVAFAVSQAHPPWSALGLYEEAELGREWRSYRREFEAAANDEQARIHFDLGGHAVGVELTEVVLQEKGGEPLEPQAPERYTVSFRFNALGCRGIDRALPRSAGVTRILMLGDSFVLGVGVHERDTVSERLQTLLQAGRGGAGYEVLNCGVSGYSTRDERRLYEAELWRYEAQVVLLGMVFNDATSWAEDAKADRRPGKAEGALALWGALQARRRGPSADFSGCAAEVRQLAASCRRHGARLGVFVFRHSAEEKTWRALADTVSRSLQGTDVPFVDLGPELTRKHSFEQLIVHEVDGHPNEIAHGLAAAALRDFLDREHLLEGPAKRAAQPVR